MVTSAQASQPEQRDRSRDVQICLNANGNARGFVRSATAKSQADVPELRQLLLNLQARSAHLAMSDIRKELPILRVRFASPRGSAGRLQIQSRARGGAVVRDQCRALSR